MDTPFLQTGQLHKGRLELRGFFTRCESMDCTWAVVERGPKSKAKGPFGDLSHNGDVCTYTFAKAMFMYTDFSYFKL